MEGNRTWFPTVSNLLRKNDKFENYEGQTKQDEKLFLRWLLKDYNAEIYVFYNHNDSKQNIRDLLFNYGHR